MSPYARSTSRAGKSEAEMWVSRLRQLIDCDYARPLTLKSLAAVVRKDRAHVAKMFRRHTGHTPHRYLTSVRIDRAAELIREGDKIEAVMLLVGYRSKKSFYRHFRARTGVTPGCYRRGAQLVVRR